MIEGKSLRTDLHHLERALKAVHAAMEPALRAGGGAARLAPLARLIAELEEYLDDEEAPALAAECALHAQAERLLGGLAPSDPAFRRDYDALRAADPGVAAAHAALLDVMAQLPADPAP